MSKISDTVLFVTVCHFYRFLNSLDLHFRISLQLYRLCSKYFSNVELSKPISKAWVKEERGDGTQEEMRKGQKLNNEPATIKNSHSLKPINTLFLLWFKNRLLASSLFHPPSHPCWPKKIQSNYCVTRSKVLTNSLGRVHSPLRLGGVGGERLRKKPTGT